MNARLAAPVLALVLLHALAPAASCNRATLAGAQAVAVFGHYAYVAAGSSGLFVLDISDPAAPVLAGSYDTPGQALGVTVAGNYAYVANGSDGLLVLDISDPSAPIKVGSFDTEDPARAVTTSTGHAFVAAGTSLQVLYVGDPAVPTFSAKTAPAKAPAKGPVKPTPAKNVR